VKKIVFLDIDGTILNTKNIIPVSAKRAVAALKKNGVEVAIATGRAPFMFRQIREELDIDTYVSFNGQYVVVRGKPIYGFSFPVERMKTFIGEAERRRHPVVMLGPEGMASNVREDWKTQQAFHSIRIQSPAFDPDIYLRQPIPQIILICEEGEEKPYREKFPDFSFVRWHPYGVDVIPKGGSKATGIDKVLQAFGISRKDSIAFGDGLNDREMLSSVGIGVAMGNAHPELKNLAKMVTRHVDEDGLFYGLKQIGLI
jgi:HAD-superfamily hydrolase, subfamily IIB